MLVFLFTLLGEVAAQTFSLNSQMQSGLSLALDDGDSACREVANARLVEEGLMLEPLGKSCFVLPGRKETFARPLLVGREQAALVGVLPPEATKRWWLYLRPVTRGMARYELLSFDADVSLELGREKTCALWYKSPLVAPRHARLRLKNGTWQVESLGQDPAVVVNGAVLRQRQTRRLETGDVVALLDLKLLVGPRVLYANQPEALSWQLSAGVLRGRLAQASMGVLAAGTVRKIEAFYPSPRLSKSLPTCTLEVEAPPAAWQQEVQPVLMRLGPSFLMGMSAALMAANSLAKITGKEALMQNLPTLSMALAMLCGSLAWPLAAHAYERREAQQKELQRCRSYVGYLDRVEDKLVQAAALQEQILKERLCSLPELLSALHERSSLVMSHMPEREGALELRVGTGDRALAAELSWPRPSLALMGDELWGRLEQLSQRPPRLKGVPLACDLVRHRAVGVLAPRTLGWEFVRGLMVQLGTLYSYRELKLVLVARRDEREEWLFATSMAHLETTDGRRRLLALTAEGMARVERLLASEQLRRGRDSQELCEPRYVVICANETLTRTSELLRQLACDRTYGGFSLVYLAERLQDLPRECGYLIDLDPKDARMFERADVEATSVRFCPDMLVMREQAQSFARDLARVRLDARDELEGVPESLGFLELMEAGSVQALNVGKRWATHDAVATIAAAVGKGAGSVQVTVDLHEDAQGPHALVAGTTGSGKSELIIAYVLSLGVNYAPDVVSFLLIDYKGGGLAGAFDNERRRLPHLAGTITNLDGDVIWRSLTSLRSELMRRQRVLNHARDLTGEATMDISRYLSLYRHGVLKEPLPHLVVIADEFAELKQQEPAFMEELMSAARIGRSLGVHLVLATQKPTGVVNDQIWSNARLKLSLKVSDAADSREMLRRDDAAHLTRPGEFCLLVGYDESFLTAQAAYCGAPYVPRDHFEERRDHSVELLDEEGEPLVALGPAQGGRGEGPSELNAVLDELGRVADALGKHAAPLWLEPLPVSLGLEELAFRYGWPDTREPSCLIGELDDPAHQRKLRLDANLTEVGNVLVCGPAGSGAEDLLCSMGASLACQKGQELWLYAADYGAGSLACLASLSCCGGVVRAGEDDRWECLLHLAERELAARKEGQASERGARPVMVLLLSNLAALCEACHEGEQRLAALMRDASRHRMHVLACADGLLDVRLRLRSCFGLQLPVALGEASDYVGLLGELKGAAVPRQRLRGLVRYGEQVLAFQGAELAREGEDPHEVLSRLAHRDGATRAPEIPQMPAHVHARDMGPAPRDLSLPVGFDVRDIEPCYVSFCRQPCQLVLGNDREQLASFVDGVLETLERAWRVRTLRLAAGGPEETELQARVEELLSAEDQKVGDSEPRVIVLFDADQIMQQVSPSCAARLAEEFARASVEEGRVWVLVCEAWRVTALYADWWRKVSSRGAGVWVGDGLADQTILRLSRLPRERVVVQAARTGYVVEHGLARAVRLLEQELDETRSCRREKERSMHEG